MTRPQWIPRPSYTGNEVPDTIEQAASMWAALDKTEEGLELSYQSRINLLRMRQKELERICKPLQNKIPPWWKNMPKVLEWWRNEVNMKKAREMLPAIPIDLGGV